MLNVSFGVKAIITLMDLNGRKNVVMYLFFCYFQTRFFLYFYDFSADMTYYQ